MKYDDFLWFIEERENIRIKKDAIESRPWTEDYILANCKFCNVDRVHDRGTTRLFNLVKSMTDWEKVFYITLYRCAISSEKFMREMTGIWMHDYRNLKFLDYSISDARKPYQVFLWSGHTVKGFLVDVAAPISRDIYNQLPTWRDVSILAASDFIADRFKAFYKKRMVFLATEIAKDLTYFFPQYINPDSMCHMNVGARMMLNKIEGRRNATKIEELLSISNLAPSSLEHSLCEMGRYLSRKHYYQKHGTLKKEWLYLSRGFQEQLQKKPNQQLSP